MLIQDKIIKYFFKDLIILKIIPIFPIYIINQNKIKTTLFFVCYIRYLYVYMFLISTFLICIFIKHIIILYIFLIILYIYFLNYHFQQILNKKRKNCYMRNTMKISLNFHRTINSQLRLQARVVIACLPFSLSFLSDMSYSIKHH